LVNNRDQGDTGKIQRAAEAESSGEESSDSKLHEFVKRPGVAPAVQDLLSGDQAELEAEMIRKSKKKQKQAPSPPQKEESSEKEEVPEQKEEDDKVEEEASPEQAAAMDGFRVFDEDEDSAKQVPDVA